MDIKQKYREEINKEPYSQNETGGYSDEYVKWLEKQLRIGGVVVPKGTLCPTCGEDESIEDWQTYYRCKLCDTTF